MTEITFPANTENVSEITAFTVQSEFFDDEKRYTTSVRKRFVIRKGLYRNVDAILQRIKIDGEIDIEWSVDPLSGKLRIIFPYGSRVEFGENINDDMYQIPRMLGFNDFFIGHSRLAIYGSNAADRAAAANTTIAVEGEYPVDLSSGRYLMFVNINIIDYQIVCNTMAPTLRVIPLLGKMRNDAVQQGQTVIYRSFIDNQFKDLLSSTVHRIVIELRDEMGRLMPFHGKGITQITLKFLKVSSS